MLTGRDAKEKKKSVNERDVPHATEVRWYPSLLRFLSDAEEESIAPWGVEDISTTAGIANFRPCEIKMEFKRPEGWGKV